MPVSVTCQSCSKTLKAPDHLVGKRVKCPACGSPLEVTDGFGGGNFSADPYGGGGGAEPGFGYGGGQSAAPGAPRTEWGKFSLGLLIVMITTLATVGLSILLIGVGVLAQSAVMIQIHSYVVLASLAAYSVGLWFCAAIPKECGERGMLQATLFLYMPASAIIIVSNLLGPALSSFTLIMLLLILTVASGFSVWAAHFFFAFSLRNIATYLKSPSLAKSAFAFLVFTASIIPTYCIYKGLYGMFASSGGGGMEFMSNRQDMPELAQRGPDGFDASGGRHVFGQMRRPPDRFDRDMPMPRRSTEPGELLAPHGTLDWIMFGLLFAAAVGWFCSILWTMRGQVMKTQKCFEG